MFRANAFNAYLQIFIPSLSDDLPLWSDQCRLPSKIGILVETNTVINVFKYSIEKKQNCGYH